MMQKFYGQKWGNRFRQGSEKSQLLIERYYVTHGGIMWLLEVLCDSWRYYVTLGGIMWLLELLCDSWSYYVTHGGIMSM